MRSSIGPSVFVTLLLPWTPVSAPAQSSQKTVPLEAREETIRLQVFLDRALFGPGKIDGLPGEFTAKALLQYQKAHQNESGSPLDSFELPKKSPLYTTYTIRPEDQPFVGELPTKPPEQSKKKALPYDSFLELVSERFHCSPSLLALLNPGIPLEKLHVGDALRVPDVEPFEIESLRPLFNLPPIPEFKSRHLTVHRKERLLTLFEKEQILASFPITPGSETTPTPPGNWRIVGITTLPNFRWDEGVLNYGVRTEVFFMLPPGPNNPVGVVWCALNKPGIGIHGTNQPDTIGRAASHGCMRVANWDVIRLAKQITSGISVIIE